MSFVPVSITDTSKLYFKDLNFTLLLLSDCSLGKKKKKGHVNFIKHLRLMLKGLCYIFFSILFVVTIHRFYLPVLLK